MKPQKHDESVDTDSIPALETKPWQEKDHFMQKENIQMIAEAYKDGMSYRQIQERYGYHPNQIKIMLDEAGVGRRKGINQYAECSTNPKPIKKRKERKEKGRLKESKKKGIFAR